MTKKNFSDEQLVAYLDGEFEFTPFHEIAQALKTDTMLGARLDALTIDKDAMAQEFSKLLAAAPAAPVLENVVALPVRSARWQNLASLAATVLVALGVGYGVAFTTLDQKKPGWVMQVASYQSLYSSTTLAHVQRPEAETATELTRVSAVIGRSYQLDDIRVPDKVAYKRGQVLNFNGKPLIQLAFLSKTGDPIALCIIQNGKPDSGKIKKLNLLGMRSAVWAKGGYEFLLIGGKDEDLIQELAAHYAKTI